MDGEVLDYKLRVACLFLHIYKMALKQNLLGAVGWLSW